MREREMKNKALEWTVCHPLRDKNIRDNSLIK